MAPHYDSLATSSKSRVLYMAPDTRVANAAEHAHYMRLSLTEARKSPLKPTNFRVGAILVDADTSSVLSTGYTLELPGNTHAEQCCLQKFAAEHGVSEEGIDHALPDNAVLYTTMEPCVERLSGNRSCVDRIVRTRGHIGSTRGIRKVYYGVGEPDTFVKKNSGREILEASKVMCFHVPGFEDEISEVATAGHVVAEGKK